MEKMLEVDSDKRINAAQTLSHPYLEEVCCIRFQRSFKTRHFIQYADPSDEPTAPFYDQTFEDYDLTVDVWKGKLKSLCNFKCLIQNLFSEKVWNTIKAFREEMFGERFMN